jgi:hypothetical protein
VFGNHIGNAVFFEDGAGQNGGIVDAMGVNYVGFAVVGDLRPAPPSARRTQYLRLRQHVFFPALSGCRYRPHPLGYGFRLASQIAEHGYDHADFHAFALQGLGLEAEKDSVHVGFGRRIPRLNIQKAV